ncbi:TRAP transporter small permease subunit [Malaciobacter marinus]|jgi:TRAP-type mannitol/chloroaromatic compound transport system permease small subunit|uniref:TRAP transporter small permease subunit n=1 Tax=Malaciobacter marinus TaxID=505249 RepID=UPI0009A603A0|nr:TRAP transporter small permease subunit [Malaciobacter marinus]SKB45911.1 TRAP-type mannitol/chloroaromatic compound transport system, small permease component [Malaciobacter marinus]
MLLKLERGFDKFANIIGGFTAIILVLMILNVFYDAIMRYLFNTGDIAMQEMEWHLFSVVILFGVSYTLKEDGHVRVDLIYDRLKPKKKAIINMIGVITFIFPITLLVIFSSIGFAQEAYEFNEISGDPGGLTHRWIIKAMIPISFSLLIITSVGFFIRNLNIYLGLHEYEDHSIAHEAQKYKEEIAKKTGDK